MPSLAACRAEVFAVERARLGTLRFHDLISGFFLEALGGRLLGGCSLKLSLKLG
jgi:hypothetical protein